MDGDQIFRLSEGATGSLSGPARVGAELRSKRERLGWSIADIAALLKIRVGFLEAIEAGDLAALPAPAYAAGFIRSYAEALSLDSDEILRRFRAEGMSPSARPALSFPKAAPDRRVPPGAIALLVGVVAIGIYASWTFQSEHNLSVMNGVPPVPAKLALLTKPKSLPAPSRGAPKAQKLSKMAPVETTPVETTPVETTPVETTPVETTPVETRPSLPAGRVIAPPQNVPVFKPDETKGSTITITRLPPPLPTSRSAGSASNAAKASMRLPLPPLPPHRMANPAARPPAAQPASLHPSRASDPAANAAPSYATNSKDKFPARASMPAPRQNIVLIAVSRTWVQVRDVHGKILFSRVMLPGESWPLPDKPGLTLTTGNAGGTELIRNGVPGPPLGPSGTVVHDELITPSGTIVPPLPSPLIRTLLRHRQASGSAENDYVNPFAIPTTGDQ